MFVLSMHASLPEMARLLLCLILSGATSVALAVLAGRFAGPGRLETAGARLGTLILMGTLVVAVNVVLLARLLFASSHDLDLLLTFVTFGIAMALAVTAPVAQRYLLALARLDRGARRIAAGEYSFRVAEDDTGGVRELAQLARELNELASGIQQAFAQQQVADTHRRQTITAVSHDLRAPVSAIQVMIEAIADGVVSDPAMVRRYHETLRFEVDRLGVLLGGLFELTQLESGAATLECDHACIGEVVVDVVDAARSRAERSGVHLAYRVESPLPEVSIDCGKMHRVVTGLLDNALRYTPPGGVITVRAAPVQRTGAKRDVRVQVIDTGQGIQAQDLDRVFEPTYRCDPARARQPATQIAPGVGSEVGLGLTIATHIIKAHGGRIWVESPLLPEARALVTLPGDPSDAPDATPGTMVSFTLPAASA
jgi:signal transduction histidine kinase